MNGAPSFDRASRRERLILVAAIALLTLLAAAYTLLGVGMNLSAIEITARVGAPAAAPGKIGIMVSAPVVWTSGYLVLVFLMWWVMMTAMMLPGALPLILSHAAVSRKRGEAEAALGRNATFLAGYLAAWAGFALVATSAQWAMSVRGMMSARAMVVSSNVLAGAILLAAGLYQFSQLKHGCLSLCRHPTRRLSDQYRRGFAGAFLMGLEHGAYCLGCCWFLMLLLFSGGVMNLYWVVGIALLVLVEKAVPRGESIGLGVGSVLILWGILFLVSATGVI